MEVNDRISPGLFSLSPEWIKFDKYELTEDSRGNVYIVPAKNASLNYYKPFEYFSYGDKKSIITDLFNINYEYTSNIRNISKDLREKYSGQELETRLNAAVQKEDYRAGKVILKFVNKYGLLGIFWTSMHTIENHEKETLVKPVTNKIHHKDVITYDEYASEFFPRMDSPYPNYHRNKSEFTKFWSEYGERVVHILNEIQWLCTYASKWDEFKRDGKKATDTAIKYYSLNSNGSKKIEIPWKYNLEQYRIGPLYLKVEYNSSENLWQLCWSNISLYESICIMYFTDLTSKSQSAKFCPHCGKPFFSKKADFHSTTCGSESRSYKSRAETERKIQELYKQDKSIDEIYDSFANKQFVTKKRITRLISEIK